MSQTNPKGSVSGRMGKGATGLGTAKQIFRLSNSETVGSVKATGTNQKSGAYNYGRPKSSPDSAAAQG